MMGKSLSGVFAFLIVFLTLSCGERDVRFGTPEYWELPAAEQKDARDSFIREQHEEGQRLFDQAVSYGTFHGDLTARQYSAWLSWVHEVEDDPVEAAEILAEWKKELVHVRRERNNTPQSIQELISWLLANQRSETGSWAPDNAPIWLHIEEIARAVELTRMADQPLNFRHRILPLGIIRDPAVVRTMVRDALERTKQTGFSRELSALAWLPGLQYATRRELEWPERWEDVVRTICVREWLDEETGGFGVNPGDGFDIETTYRLIHGWNDDFMVLSYIPSPQKLAPSIISMADTIPDGMKPYATALLVGCIADQDSLLKQEVCSVITQWQADAFSRISAGNVSGDSLIYALWVAMHSGLLGGSPADWMSLAGCVGMEISKDQSELLQDIIIENINSVDNITIKLKLKRYMSYLL